jgi:hypothetical protein
MTAPKAAFPPTKEKTMRFGASLFLIAAGAILKFAVTDNVRHVDLGVVGVILMIVGAAGVLLELALMARRRNTVITNTPGTTYVSQPEERPYY